jgi:AraC-like DNA-binding protein
MQDRWASFVARNLCEFSIRTQRESNFKVDAQTRSDSGFVVARFNTVAGRAQLERTAAEIRSDGRDSYCLYVPVHGAHQLHQCHRDAVCAPDTVALITVGEPYIQTKLGDNDTFYLLMPRTFVDQRLIHGEDLCARLVSARDGVGRLAADTLAALQREASKMSAEEFRVATRAAGDLVLLAVGGAADLMSDVRSIRASNLARAKRVMRARLGDADLSLTDVARACGLSLRYLHDLFRDDGRTVREYLQGERLLSARRMLERSTAGKATVTDICMACGFSNPSQFSTAFRRAFGVSPRDVLRRS